MTKAEMLKALAEGQGPLALSIQKWKDIVDGTGENLGRANCALCHLFYKKLVPLSAKSFNNCVGCPIEIHTGSPLCWDTPYLLFLKNEDLETAKNMLTCLEDIQQKTKK